MKLKNIRITAKLLVVSLFIVIVSLVALGLVSLNSSKKGIVEVVEATLNEQTKTTLSLVEMGYGNARDHLEKSITAMQRLINRSGGVVLNPAATHRVAVTNQVTKQTMEISLPDLAAGGRSLFHDYNDVDEVAAMYNVSATVFQLIPGGMLRISTNVKTDQQTRAVDTFIPDDSPVYQSIARGQAYFGIATIMDKQYLTSYVPLQDSHGNIVGALYAGNPIDTVLNAPIELIRTSVVGKTGYMYVMDGKGVLLIHPKSEGQDISQNDFAQEIIEKKEGFITYKWEDRLKVTSYRYFEPLDWYIVSGAYFEDYTDLLGEIRTAIILSVLFSSIAVFVLMWLLSSHINANIRGIVNQVAEIAESMSMGRLDRRGFADDAAVDFRSIVVAVNEVIDVFVAPINVMAEYVDRIAKGDPPPKITDEYHGDFNEIKNNLNHCIDVLESLLGECRNIIVAAKSGQLHERAREDVFEGRWQKLVAGLNQVIDAFAGPFHMAAENIELISKGEIPPKITDEYQGDFNEIKNSINDCIDTVTTMLAEARNVCIAVLEGRLDQHARLDQLQGRWQKLMNGYNDISKAFSGPIVEAISRFELIGRGEIPEPITTQYNGDFNRIKDSVNAAIAGLQGLVEANGVLQKMARNDYTNKVNGEYKGIYSQVGAAVNHVIERLERVQNIAERIGSGDLSDLEGLKKTGKRCENDRLNPALIAMIEAIGLLLADARDLANSAREGNLKARADATRHAGAYRDLIAGVNDLLNAVVTPLTEAMNVMEKLATKQMTARMTGVYKGDLNEFKQNINNAADNLDEALTQVDLAVEQISSAAGQISTGSQTLAESTSEQASSLEEVASSLEEMHSLTVGNADNARQGATLSQQALASVQKGNEAMGRMNEAMASISQSAEQTGKIIKTIDEIAFQTNLLALNAAVEAAHAGEAGKGFAVVAEEVKNLALRSAEAAKNTNELIEGSLKNSEAGTKIVHQVTESFGEIRTSFEKVNSIVNEISAASDEQAEGIGQVNTAINEMNQLTQRNAANAEESASAAEELNSQASELGSMVREFTLSQAHGRGKGRGGRVEDRRRPQKALPGKSAAMYEVSPDKVLPLDDVEEGDFKDF